jgi:uncharacterized protein
MSDLISNDHTTVTEATRSVIAAAYKAAQSSDMAAIMDLLDPEVVLHEPASQPNGGVHRGLQNVLQALVHVFETFDMNQLTLKDIIVDGQRAVGLVNLVFRAREGGHTVAEVWHVRNGRIVEIRPYYWDTVALLRPAS